MTLSKPRKHAFTLIETLIAIFILEVGIMGVAGFFTSSFKTTRVARNETQAANLASGLLDSELGNSYDNLAIGAGSKERYSSDANNPFYDWYKKIDVAYIDMNLSQSDSDTGMKKIIVTVYWLDNGTERSFQTASIKAKH